MERKVRYEVGPMNGTQYENGTLIDIKVVGSYTYAIILKQDGKFEKIGLGWLLDGWDPPTWGIPLPEIVDGTQGR